MADLEQRFEAAQAAAQKLPAKPDYDTLLELYSYFKQATEGDVTGARPGAFDFVARAKFDAWGARRGSKRTPRCAPMSSSSSISSRCKVTVRSASACGHDGPLDISVF